MRVTIGVVGERFRVSVREGRHFIRQGKRDTLAEAEALAQAWRVELGVGEPVELPFGEWGALPAPPWDAGAAAPPVVREVAPLPVHVSARARGMTCAELLDRWVAYQEATQPRETTAAMYRAVGRRWKVALGELCVSDLDDEVTKRVVVKWTRAGLSGATIRQASLVFRGVLKWAGERELVTARQVATVGVKVKCDKPQPKSTLAPEDVASFLAAYTSPELETAARLALFAGCRRTEIMLAQWRDFDAQKRVLACRKTKRGKPRIAVLPDVLVAYLNAEYLRQGRPQQDCPICPLCGTTSPRTDPRQLYEGVVVACRRARVPPVSLHELRHTFATEAIAGGASVGDLQAQLGHASAWQTYTTYVHAVQSRARGVVDAVEWGLTGSGTAPKEPAPVRPTVVRRRPPPV